MKLKKEKKRNKKSLIGVINITQHGYAFVKIPSYNKDIFIPKNETHRALEGDFVKIQLQTNKKRIQGKVIRILKRKKKQFIGILKYLPNLKRGEVNVYNNGKNVLKLGIPYKQYQKYSNNDKVLVEMISWPKKLEHPLGRIIKTYGTVGEYNTEFFSLLEEYQININFPKEIEHEAKKIALKNVSDWKSRRDMRHINTFTIDPTNAKDFDDALSIRKLNEKIWEIGIHISDVSYYVKEDSLLDKEAYSRSTSIYFVGKVIPMLPKILSNHVCSLQPKKDKLSFSFVFNINHKGEILENWLGKTIIQSNKKFTYREVQEIIDQKRGDYCEEINALFLFSKILCKKRLKNGSIYLEKEEINFHLDHKKNPVSIFLEKNKDAHRLIEEFMLLTNKKISEFVSFHIDQKKTSYIYRVHDEPDIEKILFLKRIIEPLGYFFNLENIKNSINHLLVKSRGRPEQNMIENLILRCMSKAKYSTKNIGHYGLSFIHYTHFTSPIRRYSDIIAHRLLHYYLIEHNSNNSIKSKEFYEKQSEYCSFKERLAIDLEREFLKFIQVKFLKKFLGKEFDGMITGFNKWSIYVDLISFQTEGVVKLSDINEDKYTFNFNDYSIIGEKKRKIYHIGDKIKVKLLNIDLERKQILLCWIGK
ncbi:ribonuclease R family protein [Blattabacterium cuenoti]|uniref:ribonuclease R family protein n=1 Tax=Blattabacterium cuenoti TaxID=1653831 RepID=UPI00163B8BC5|nr:ribonuclease R family protein [Blattabacterium cuenoti]